jgi:hypothetical protein
VPERPSPRWSVRPGAAWSGWGQISGTLSTVAAQADGEERIHLFGVTSSGIAPSYAPTPDAQPGSTIGDPPQ